MNDTFNWTASWALILGMALGCSAPKKAPPVEPGARCVAVISLELDGEDDELVAAEVVLDEELTPSWAPGLIVQAGADRYVVRVVSREKTTTRLYESGHETRIHLEWDTLVARRLRPDGAAEAERTWIDLRPEPDLEEEPDPDLVLERYEAIHRLTITGIAGPWLGYHAERFINDGGAHGHMDNSYGLIRAPDPKLVSAAELAGDSAVPAFQAFLNDELARRDGFWGTYGTPAVNNLRDLPSAGFALHAFPTETDEEAPKHGALGFFLTHSFECCSWAENGGVIGAEARLDRVPEAFAPHVVVDSSGMLASPDGSCAIGLDDAGRLTGRVGRDGPVHVLELPLPRPPERVIGVVWLRP